MDESTNTSPCKDCNDGVDESQLRTELEHLRQHIAERDVHFLALENEFYKCTSRANDLEEQLDTWREKYERLYDSHKRVQKLNQVLEDKLLQMVDKMKSEKSQLTKDIATLSVRLAESKHNYSMLQKENERYKNDMNLAIQLLQCKPDNFVAQKLDSLPVDTQARVSQYVMSKTTRPGSLTGVGKIVNDNDTFDASEYEFNISASLMTKILEDSIQDTVTKHCDTCTCGKSQNKPFCYNESYYSISTQTIQSGEMNPLCLNCNSEIKSLNSNYSIRSISPHTIKLVNEKVPNQGPIYIAQPTIEEQKENIETEVGIIDTNVTVIDLLKPAASIKLEPSNKKELEPKTEVEPPLLKNNNSVTMEPAIHHKLCDRTKTSISSKKSIHSIQSVTDDDLLIKEIPIDMEVKPKNLIPLNDNLNVRKNSQSSMAGSRTSSIAKSTISTHKSNTHVGPGPRFCHLRMQAGSKNILLDNAEPDVPPVLYRRQSKSNDNSIFKDLNDGMDNFIDLAKPDDDIKNDNKNDNVVVESTLIDVHEDNNNKESNISAKSTSINPILLNVSSSPLQPLKTHNFSNSSENNNNNNNTQSIGSQQNPSEIDHLLNDFNVDVNAQNNNIDHAKVEIKKTDVFNVNDHQELKIFNFDRYEQSKVASQFPRPLKKIDMSQLHSIENTKISKDLAPQGVFPSFEKNPEPPKPPLPAIVNVYPNLTQTHLKVNENNKVFTNEQSTSSLSSDDSAALLQKQQLLRVAEWVEKNLEQQNNFNDPLDYDCSYSNRVLRRDSKLSRLTETLNELALNMPHPVSKYSKYARESHNNYVHHANFPNNNQDASGKTNAPQKVNVVKETIFPVECNDLPITEVNNDNTQRNVSVDTHDFDPGKKLKEALKNKGDKEISPEDLARMEYNVKKFLLSGPHWVNSGAVGRSRRTSSKTETDV